MARSTDRRPGQPRAAAGRGLLAVLACLLLAGCASAGDAATTPTGAPSSDAPVATSAPTTTPSDPAEPVDPVPVTDASLAAAAAGAAEREAGVPVEVAYDRLGWTMPVDAVGVAPDGQMEVPADALRAGWYRYGPAAGEARGTVVLAAHAGSYVTPRGPFAALWGAAEGDALHVVRDDGVEVRYEVVAVEEIEKDEIDLQPYFDRSGPPRLVLITCGGVWDEDRQSYASNVLVTAVPVP